MRTAIAFVFGLLIGSVLVSSQAQELRLAGENYMNHVAVAVENFDEAFAFYTKKMGFREVQQANANRRPGLNHFGLHVENLGATVATLKQRGVTVEEPRSRPDDSSVANATDPNGIRIEMFEFGPQSPQGKAIASWK
jgi:catechol 2,3-dioxygenase-like lactoylglutathione lyase family enzyme